MQKCNDKTRKYDKGFTLIELIVVIAIIAVLAVVIAPQYTQFIDRARKNADLQTAVAMDKVIHMLVADGTISTETTISWYGDSSGSSCDIKAHNLKDKESNKVAKKVRTSLEEIVGNDLTRKSNNAPPCVWIINYPKDGDVNLFDEFPKQPYYYGSKGKGKPLSFDSDKWK